MTSMPRRGRAALAATALAASLAVPVVLSAPAAAATSHRCGLYESTIYVAGAKTYLVISTVSSYSGGRLTAQAGGAFATVQSTTGKTHTISGRTELQFDSPTAPTKAYEHFTVTANAAPGHVGYAVNQSGYTFTGSGTNHHGRAAVIIAGHAYATPFLPLWAGTTPC